MADTDLTPTSLDFLNASKVVAFLAVNLGIKFQLEGDTMNQEEALKHFALRASLLNTDNALRAEGERLLKENQVVGGGLVSETHLQLAQAAFVEWLRQLDELIGQAQLHHREGLKAAENCDPAAFGRHIGLASKYIDQTRVEIQTALEAGV